jgi:hypothetical protein
MQGLNADHLDRRGAVGCGDADLARAGHDHLAYRRRPRCIGLGPDGSGSGSGGGQDREQARAAKELIHLS